MFDVLEVSIEELELLASRQESYLLDFKAKEISAGKVQKHFVAFANSDGGDIYVGINDHKEKIRLAGFDNPEQANSVTEVCLQHTQPAVEGVLVEFLHHNDCGYVLHIMIPKSERVHHTSAGDCYIRVNASSRRISGPDVLQLSYGKGFVRFEDVQVSDAEISDILDSGLVQDYLMRLKSVQEPLNFLRRNRLLPEKESVRKPSVACVLLFDSEPQDVIPSKCSVKIIRMQTTDSTYRREQLDSTDVVTGSIETVARRAEERVLEIMKESTFTVGKTQVKVSYPLKAVHEVLVNAILHRDYSLASDVHVTIFDDRIETTSPGRLPGNVTVDNIRKSHFARNPNVVRLVHKLPEPINHDMGEGLDTAFNAMRDAGLVNPEIFEDANSVVVTLRHKRLASYEDQIMEHIEKTGSISNREARALTGEGSENRIKASLKRLREAGRIEFVDPKTSVFKRRYQKVASSDGS